MNRPIVRLYGLVIVMFALLIAFTSRWTVFSAASLRANKLNQRALLAQERIKRGPILAADATVLARSVRTRSGVYDRRYPADGLFAHAAGYSSVEIGQAGLEQSYSSYLNGTTNTGLTAILDQLQGRRPQGDTVNTSLEPTAQRVALRDLGGQPGAVLALDPHTGAIKVMASVPGYDPATLDRARLAVLNHADQSAPLLNRTTQSGYPPGSTFKVVTDIAALDSGQFTPNSVLNGDSPKVISGVPLINDGNQSFGNITLTDALTFSVNTVWAQVGVQLGKPTMGHYMRLLGFNRQPPIDLPPSEVRASGEYFTRRGRTRLVAPTSPLVDVGRMAFGQDHLEVTPLQMAMVAAAVADDGVVVAPHLVDTVVNPDGQTVRRNGTRVLDRAMSARTASEVGDMMAQVVKEGTGTAAALNGIQVAGKTGTAQTSTPGESQVWFIAYAPQKNPRYAIAVTIERSTGQGGTVAAPIARDVLESLLQGGGNA
jgi:peptidoglycan glycosyltransferase